LPSTTSHWDTLCACDFFSVEALGITGTVRYMVFFVTGRPLEPRRRILGQQGVEILGIAVSPGGAWMEQMARNLVDGVSGGDRIFAPDGKAPMST
jgi:hypothetical protein